ncbi:hypothetical protein DFP72DRAFT_881369 [Ephemerocybe angulata]|uniref:Uncharacterized protein n=1 Tax=Ephemerocybe angulata TaxID=980116 RepID=A0A8H6MD43_9AGAR|nr:hypothetical protein DFP72DRAFT_881369 [Tulosesus angulatus]
MRLRRSRQILLEKHPSSHGAYNCEKLSVSFASRTGQPTTYQLEHGGHWRLGRVSNMNGGCRSQSFALAAQRPTPVHDTHSMRQAPPPHSPHWSSRLALAAGIVTRDTGLRLRQTRVSILHAHSSKPSATHRDSAPSPSPFRLPMTDRRPHTRTIGTQPTRQIPPLHSPQSTDGSRCLTVRLIAKAHSPEPQHDGRRRDDRAATSASPNSGPLTSTANAPRPGVCKKQPTSHGTRISEGQNSYKTTAEDRTTG